MKQFKVFVPLFLALLLVVCVAAASDATVSITVRNNRSQAMSLAFCWNGVDPGRSGWHNVPAGTSKTFTFKDANYGFNDGTNGSFGYYATSGKSVWAGKSSDASMIINPKGSFDGAPNDPISGGKKVFVRRVNLKATSSDGIDGAATLTFGK